MRGAIANALPWAPMPRKHSDWRGVTPRPTEVMSDASDAEPIAEREPVRPFKPLFRFSLEFGPVWLGADEVQAPPPNSTSIDFRSIGVDVSPTISAILNFEWFIDDHQKLLVGLWPYEVRSRQTLAEDVSFAVNEDD